MKRKASPGEWNRDRTPKAMNEKYHKIFLKRVSNSRQNKLTNWNVHLHIMITRVLHRYGSLSFKWYMQQHYSKELGLSSCNWKNISNFIWCMHFKFQISHPMMKPSSRFRGYPVQKKYNKFDFFWLLISIQTKTTQMATRYTEFWGNSIGKSKVNKTNIWSLCIKY